MHLIIVSGRSGSGKTIALHALEDLGFYCIDNLPISFLPDLPKQVGKLHPRIAVSIDARNITSDPAQLDLVFNQMIDLQKDITIIYLDAEENTLLKRFNETRRKHPLTNQTTSLREAIRKEQILLTPIATRANLTIDTNTLTHQELYKYLKNRMSTPNENQVLVLLQSFGFKYGLPHDADFIFDVRCLPNPYWEPELKNLSGLDSAVENYLERIPKVNQLRTDICSFIEKWIPCFQADNRSYISISIGCTGGQHRSVYMVESIAEKIQQSIPLSQIRHRELETSRN